MLLLLEYFAEKHYTAVNYRIYHQIGLVVGKYDGLILSVADMTCSKPFIQVFHQLDLIFDDPEVVFVFIVDIEVYLAISVSIRESTLLNLLPFFILINIEFSGVGFVWIKYQFLVCNVSIQDERHLLTHEAHVICRKDRRFVNSLLLSVDVHNTGIYDHIFLVYSADLIIGFSLICLLLCCVENV